MLTCAQCEGSGISGVRHHGVWPNGEPCDEWLKCEVCDGIGFLGELGMSDSTECKACFGQGWAEEGDPETGGNMVPCDNCLPEFVDVRELQRISHELRTYNPSADPHKGAHIHKVWAREIDKALAGSAK